MDERIMKVLEAAGARIADLEADLADKDAELVKKENSADYWFTEGNRIEAENKALRDKVERLEKKIAVLLEERASVEAVD